jgi:hypothetical protein
LSCQTFFCFRASFCEHFNTTAPRLILKKRIFDADSRATEP